MARDTAALEAAFGPPLMGQPRCSDPKLQPERSAKRRSDNASRFEETSRSVLIPIGRLRPFFLSTTQDVREKYDYRLRRSQ